MDENDIDSQWTAAAQNTYAQRAEDLIAEIRRHVESNLRRQGRQAEMQLYFESGERLQAAAKAFNEAEFDWCGSFPLALREVEDAWDEDDSDQHEVGNGYLSAFGRWDFQVLDPEAVVAAGRAAYLAAWPDDPEEDIEVRVPDVVRAVSEIVHAHGFWSLQDTAGLDPDRHVTMFLAHDGDDDFGEDPFAISRA